MQSSDINLNGILDSFIQTNKWFSGWTNQYFGWNNITCEGLFAACWRDVPIPRVRRVVASGDDYGCSHTPLLMHGPIPPTEISLEGCVFNLGCFDRHLLGHGCAPAFRIKLSIYWIFWSRNYIIFNMVKIYSFQGDLVNISYLRCTQVLSICFPAKWPGFDSSCTHILMHVVIFQIVAHRPWGRFLALFGIWRSLRTSQT